jgi:hypothetical protein
MTSFWLVVVIRFVIIGQEQIEWNITEQDRTGQNKQRLEHKKKQTQNR